MKNLTKRASALLLTLLGVALLSAAQVKLTPSEVPPMPRPSYIVPPMTDSLFSFWKKIFPNLKPAPRTCPTQKTPQTTKQALSLVNSQKCLVGLALAFAKQEAHAP